MSAVFPFGVVDRMRYSQYIESGGFVFIGRSGVIDGRTLVSEQHDL